MRQEKFGTYSSLPVTAMGILSLVCALAVLVLFIVSISIFRPSFHDLNKFAFTVLCIDFFLTCLYSITTFIKDNKIQAYGANTWLCCVITFTIIAILNSVTLYKHHDRVLITIVLAIPLGVGVIALTVNTQFYFCVAVTAASHRTYQSMKSIDELSDYESDGESKGFIKNEVRAPADSLVKDYAKEDPKVNVQWVRTHFILAIENGLTLRKRWKQLVGGIRSWLRKLSDSEDTIFTVFSFDSLGYKEKLYKNSREMAAALDSIFPVKVQKVSLDTALNTYQEVLKSTEGRGIRGKLWLHYGVLITTEEATYTKKTLENFIKFNQENKINFFLKVLTQTGNKSELNKLTKELKGVHYSINKRANFGKAFVEAMNTNPSNE